jgi:WD40 repeat protein
MMMRLGVLGSRAIVPVALVGSLLSMADRDARGEPLPVAELPKDRKVDFTRDVEPVLKKNCVACHNSSVDEAGVNLESPEAMKASDAYSVLVPGDPTASRLFMLASHAEEPVMPPEDNDVQAKRFDAMELALLKRWIEQGAPYDPKRAAADMATLQPLPPTVQTVYASALTVDGDVSAVGFGNQIDLFSRKSTEPLETLTRKVDGKSQPAHDDFVQDLAFSPDGQTLVSAGYRNVKIWRRQSLREGLIPQIKSKEALAFAVNVTGTHVATLSPRGEVAVARVGKPRWDWMKGFDLPAKAADGKVAGYRLAVSPSARTVAVAAGAAIWIARSDAAEVTRLPCDSPVASLAFITEDTFCNGHASGALMRHHWSEGQWRGTEVSTEASPLQHLVAAPSDASFVVAVNAAGKVWRWDLQQESAAAVGDLPAAVQGVALLPGERPALWVASDAGVLGSFDLTENKYVEIAKADPAAAQRHRDDQWQTVVAQKVQAATEAELKAAEANAKAERESLDKIAKDIEAKQKTLEEAKAALVKAKQQSDADAKALADAKTKQQAANEQRAKLAASLKQLDASIEQMKKQLEALGEEKQETEAKLTALPDEKMLAETVKKASEAADKSAEEAKQKQDQHDDANEALQQANGSKQRGEKRLESLNGEVEKQKQTVERAKADLAAKQQQEKKSKGLLDQAVAASGSPQAIHGGKYIVTRNGSTGGLSLWAGDGTWLGAIDAPADVVAAGGNTLLVRSGDELLSIRQLQPELFQLDGQIGSATGDSPFGDRVLCVAIDPSGRYLVTGGGLPSRTGELMLWNLSDGSLVRQFDKPHDDTVLSVRFSPDGKRLASGGADRMVHLWDVESGKRLSTLEGHTHHVTAVGWDLDGREVSSGAADGIVKVWDLKTGKASRTISGIKSEVTRLEYLGSDGRVGITSGDGYFSVYRADNGRRETHAKIPAGYLYALDRNRDGSELIVGGADGLAVLVDKSGKTLQSFAAER